MADNKKYYYMRLKDNFFEDETIVLLESMQDGYLYSNILLKLYLKSVKTEGKLLFNNFIPYSAEMIATITRHQVGVVEKALDTFEKLGLIEVLDNGTIYMMNIQSYIGKSSTEADRIRNYRNKISAEKNEGVQMYGKCTPKIEIEIEKEIDTKIEKDINKAEKQLLDVQWTTNGQPMDGIGKDSIGKDRLGKDRLDKDNIYTSETEAIITYLNQKTDSRFKASTSKTKSLIKARLKEGYTVNDFYAVIDKKTQEWKGTDYEKYLRPETLFGNKFEGYLNQKSTNTNESLFSRIARGEVNLDFESTGNRDDPNDTGNELSLPF